MRPPGYEPGELPTAPLRDVSYFATAKVLLYSEMTKYFLDIFNEYGLKHDIAICKSRLLYLLLYRNSSCKINKAFY